MIGNTFGRPSKMDLRMHDVSSGCWSGGLIFLLLGMAFSLGAIEAQNPRALNVDEQYAFAAPQYKGMLEHIKDDPRLPRTFNKGEVILVQPQDWTSGFFPGSLWLLLEQTRDTQWKKDAMDFTHRLESLRTHTSTHDLGFMLYCSYGNGWRLTKNPAYRDILLAGARNLAARCSPKVGLIRSWDWGPWKYPVIIDNMMNLELLMFAYAETGEAVFRDIAVNHANKTIQNHFRPDHSSFHVVDYDPETGAVLSKQTWQGFSNQSAWARGQMWGLYGFTMMHRLTKDPAYLTQARKIADFLIGHKNMPADKIPYWDFTAPGIPNEPRDASAAAIMASALLELADMVDGDVRSRYQTFAEDQLHSLSSPAYHAPLGENGNFILMHCTGDMPRTKEVNTPLIYADYYYLEALARYERQSAKSR